MNASPPFATIVDREHLRGASDHNVHLVRWANDPDHLESVVREAAAALDYHLAVLDGKTIHTEADLLNTLARAFLFPENIRARATEDWNVTGDLMGDLSWLLRGPGSRKGVLTLIRDPGPFMRENLIQFAFLIHELASCSQWVVRTGIPFSIVVGPLPEDARYEIFMNFMAASKHFCEACQCVDCPCSECESDQPDPGCGER